MWRCHLVALKLIHFTSKAKIVCRQLGPPGAEPSQIARARRELSKGIGIGKEVRMYRARDGYRPQAQARNGDPIAVLTLTARVRFTP